eukprot:362754-Chlamydomonas_euryale.AAC.11
MVTSVRCHGDRCCGCLCSCRAGADRGAAAQRSSARCPPRAFSGCVPRAFSGGIERPCVHATAA